MSETEMKAGVEMEWTKQQEAAIKLRKKNILVSAAAGSGKTAVLVERIKQLILEDATGLEEMLIVTFSNAAASELREKIVKSIILALEDEGVDKEKQNFLHGQLNIVHKANISTFHAFAMEVIRRYFQLIQVDPNLKICDEGQKSILQGEAMEALFSGLFTEEDPDFLYFLRSFSGSKNENAAKEMIKSTYDFIQSLAEPLPWLLKQVEALRGTGEEFLKSPGGEALLENICQNLTLVLEYFSQVEELLSDQGIESLEKKCKGDYAAVSDALEAFSGEALTQTSFVAALTALGTARAGLSRFVCKKEEKERYEAIKEEVGSLRDKGKGILSDLVQSYALRPFQVMIEEMKKTYRSGSVLYRLVESFTRCYSRRKETKGVLDFSDIEHFALQILAHEEAAGEYREKFKYIFIDEYQDSNMVQETLISCIKRENNLFMVGDVKQSIYKFRLSEPQLFIDKYQFYKTGQDENNVKLDLNRNFRSKGNIISGVNRVFSHLMKQNTTGLSYDEEAALHNGLDYNGPLDYGLSLHLVDDKAEQEDALESEIKEMKRAEVEGYTAAQIIKEAKGTLIFDCKEGVERPLSYKDMVVLLRGAKTTGQIYHQIFTDEGIPAFVDSSDGYFDTVEIQVFLNLLRIVDNEKQDVPLMSVMRSPILNFTIDELAQIRICHKEGTYFEAFSAYADCGEEKTLQKKCAGARETLGLFQQMATYMPLAEFLWKLIEKTGYDYYVLAIPGGSQRYENLRALVDKAEKYEATQGFGLFGFIRYIEALQKGKVTTGQVKLVGENDQVVRIMTVHKSKGLEFPFVLLGGLGKGFNLRQDSAKVSLHKDLGVALRYVDLEHYSYRKPLLQTLIEQKKRREDMAEEIRILYVAFTRAQDSLVLLATASHMDQTLESYRQRQPAHVSAAKSYLDLLLPALKDSGIPIYRHDLGELSIRKSVQNRDTNRIREGLKTGFSKEVGEQPELEKRLSFVYPYGAANGVKSKYSVSELSRMESLGSCENAQVVGALMVQRDLEARLSPLEESRDTVTPKFLQGEKTFTGAQRGTILHKVMEALPFKKIGDLHRRERLPAIGDFIALLIRREILSTEEARTVNPAQIAAFFDTELGQRACRADEIYKEVSFNLRKEVLGQEVLVQGTIDCYFREGEHYVLFDYKSGYSAKGDQASLQVLCERYGSQVRLYGEALEKIRKIKVDELYLYLFGPGKSVRL